MAKSRSISVCYLIAALYDGILGVAFLVAAEKLFRLAQVTPPNHFGYVQFPAALLLIFALMFLAIAKDPTRNRNLIPYGILLKLCYVGVVFFYWFTSGIPFMWKPFAIMDLVFILVFCYTYRSLGHKQR